MASLMNGLSAMGQGLSQFAGAAGLEELRADAEQRRLTLADKLTTARESAGRQEAGQIAATAAEKEQAFQAAQTGIKESGATGRTAMTIAGQSSLETQKAQLAQQQMLLADQIAAGKEGRTQAFAASESEKTRAGELERTKTTANASLQAANVHAGASRDVANIGANADPEVIRTLRALNAMPGQSPSPAPSGSTQSTPPVGGAQDASASGNTPPDQTVTLRDSILAKTFGTGTPGSEIAIRSAIANDVSRDPAWKYKSAGQQAAEIESRLAVASGKMTDPASRDQMAAAIASYQLAPLSNFALTKSGGPETMAKVMALNPDYQEGRYPEVNKAMQSFGSGKQGDVVRFLNVGVQHLDAFDEAALALKNNNVRAINSLTNYFEDQFGVAAPNTFNGLKQIVGTEIEKAVSGGIGAVSDRDRLMKALDRANSPEQLQSITNSFRTLMAGQLHGLKTQYEDATGFKSGPFAFANKLDPATIKALGGGKPTSGATAPTDGRPPLSSFIQP